MLLCLAVVARLIIFVLFRAGAAKVGSKMASRFVTVAEEQILAVNEGAVAENAKKATNLACFFFTGTVFPNGLVYTKNNITLSVGD